MTTGRAGSDGARHLIGDVQRFGLLSAAAVVNRYTEIVDRAVRADGLASAPPLADARADAWMVDNAARMAEVCLRLIDSAAALASDRPQGTAAATEGLALSPTGPGFSSETSLWVHNPTSAPVPAIDLHMTSLISSNGVSIPRAATFSPERLEMVEAGSAKEVRLRVDVPADQDAGRYHGLVVSSAASSEPIAVHLDVLGRGGGGDDDHE